MLTIAVALTLVGFGLLVFALVSSNFALAIACIVVCVVGLAVLLIDTIRAGKRGGTGVDDEPLFTIRGRESSSRAEPLADDDVEEPVADRTPSWDADPEPEASGLGSIVSPEAHGSPVPLEKPIDSGRLPTFDTGQQPRFDTGQQPRFDTGQQPRFDTGEQPRFDTGQQPVEAETGDANDYIRSVTGQFPAASQTGRIPAVQSYQPNPQPLETSDPTTGGQPQINTDSGYVGRRRRVEGESDSVVVNTPDPSLPAMKLVYGDEPGDADSTGEPRNG
ncbi:hypothetical protein WKY82_15250 [Gordonia malaquae]|uniref:hypothetical protein n=1 Tax=Gordonia TaxID=2053 RepID=UPI0030C7A120